MAREFVIPAIDEGVETVDLASLTVSEGDVIEAGAVVAEVETDKADMEIEAEWEGTLSEIRVAEGDVALVGEVLAVIGEPSASPGAQPESDASTARDTPAAPIARQEGAQNSVTQLD